MHVHARPSHAPCHALRRIGFALALPLAALLLAPVTATAAPAIVTVPVDGRFAPPPPPPFAPPPHFAPPPSEPVFVANDEPRTEPELYRSPFRLHVGPAALTSGRGLSPGLAVAADFGRGSVGLRLAATWLRGEPGHAAPLTETGDASSLAGGLAQYTGELTIDFHKRGPLHPVLGVGAGIARTGSGERSGTVGIGVARLTLEYALALDDADVRLGVGILGALPGPADREVSDVRGYALLGASIGVGF